MLYFTSDLHFGHENMLRICRDFSCVEEMDRELIRRWNERVRDRDTVYICGDFCYRNQTPAAHYLRRLRGRKILLAGNHDRQWLKNMDETEKAHYFAEIGDIINAKYNGVKLRFCHYPMLSWESARRGAVLICGHIHGARQGMEYDLFRQIPFAFNAGVDLHDYRPVTFRELVENNLRFYNRKLTAEEQKLLQDHIRAMEA